MTLRSQFPFKLAIGGEDVTYLLDNGYTFSNVDPGGFEMASFQIPKDMPQSIRGLPVRLDCGLGVAFEGRISGPQRSLGQRTTITCEGYAARAKDAKGAMIFVDRDLTRWQGPTLARQIQKAAPGTFTITGPSTGAEPGSGSPTLTLSAQAPWTVTSEPFAEAFYDARGIPLQYLYYAWLIVNGSPAGGGQIDSTDTNWTWNAQLSLDDVFSSFDDTGQLRAAGVSSGAGLLTATTASRVCANLQVVYNAAKASSELATLYWENVAVYGRHGLTLRGAAPSGFYPSDIAGWVVSQVPGLQPGTIQTTDATGYILPHCVYYDPVSLDTMLNDMAIKAAWNWSVWEAPNYLVGSDQRPRLDFQPRPVDGTWQASAWRNQCETIDIHEDLNGLYDTAIVQYTGVDGTARSVTVTLSNPYLDQSGIGLGAGGPGRVVIINAGVVAGLGASTSAASVASSYGIVCLALLMQQARLSGSITIREGIQDAGGGPIAAWMLHAGQQRIRIPDLPSTDYSGLHNDLPVTRVECSVNKDAIETHLDIGQGSNLLETFQARATTAQQLVGL